jgi:predicted GNAT family acetyltransferase
MHQVIHQEDNHRFIVELDGEPAKLDYRFIRGDKVDFTSTYVPFRQRGKGLAEALVEAGLSWARFQGLEIEASCWYVEKFLDEANS